MPAVILTSSRRCGVARDAKPGRPALRTLFSLLTFFCVFALPLSGRSVQASPVPTPINRSKAKIGAAPTTTNEKKLKVGAEGTEPTALSSSPRGNGGQWQVQTYDQLVHAIRQARAASRARVEQAVQQEKVREAWETGKLIDEHILQHKERADYGKQVLLKLAKDLGMSETELGYMLQFARAYPISPHAGKLSWSDYRELLAVNVPEKRNALAERAEKEDWDRERLRSEVRNITESGKAASEEALTARPGKVGTYRVILAQSGPFAGELALDLGFSTYVRLSEVAKDASQFKEGDIVTPESMPGLTLRGKPGMSLRVESESQGASSESLLYTYNAWVYRVLDGDTVEAVVDLGFGIVVTQTLRLRGLDAPELVSKEGKEAKAFLESVIASPAGAKQSVLIRTSKSDKYDRYLVDIWTGETYVNQELLEKGYAVKIQS